MLGKLKVFVNRTFPLKDAQDSNGIPINHQSSR